MFFYLSPIQAALIVMAVLCIFLLMPAARAWRHYFFKRRRFLLLSIDANQVKTVFDYLLTQPTPFVLEAAVHVLGKEVHYYIAVPKGFGEKVINRWGARPAEEYELHRPGNSCLGFYLKSFSAKFDWTAVDFSKVNEIGESALVQLLVTPHNKSRLINWRVLISAPSPYQAQEIAFSLNASLSEFKPTPVNRDLAQFIHLVAFREFDRERLTSLE